MPSQPEHIVRQTYLAFLAILLVWTGVWGLKLQLDEILPTLDTHAGSFFYWTVAKVLVWIVPAYGLIRLSGRTSRQVFNFPNYKRWLLWGIGIGLLIALTGFIPSYLAGRPVIPTEFTFALFNVLIIAPIFEEYLIRGAVLGNLQLGYSFWVANFISSLLFLSLHMPGWYFSGNLVQNLAQPVGGALSILIVSLLFGYAARRGDSVIAAMIAHFLNNLS